MIKFATKYMMFGKKQMKNFAQIADPYKVWKEKPPGPEQKELVRMFDCKEIDASATPESVRKSNLMFQQFSPKVFAVHFRKIKAKYGLCASVLNLVSGPSHMLELGYGDRSPPPSPPPSPQPSSSMDDNGAISFIGAPFFTWIYTDHDKRCDFVCVALPIISGSRDINFSLSDDGQTVTVDYIWPNALYITDQLFKDVPKTDPKVHSFISHMLDCGITEKSKPQGSIVIKLPCKVKREVDDFSKKAVKVEDTKIILLQFTAYQKKKIINDADTSIKFD